ncbi:MAG: hypothetical protein A2445_03600 [Candidatus Jacksonbacteria bacterium RIFOXYC2_FULL_44_29]|nr:MAG: LexA repressor [Parcubacteria group bacterium GW2011_GWA2_42_28]KKT53812.1 MAG: LexA repressor [Parcubacteria group bacterium GW2011_GWC2_44_22]OGY76737.1 MAG: hypothetical protein A2240_00785 [Candidatus Jacksonbacteria bacterium RIFOXYA2_FULL_43_12]OGY77313.1 MAG: hypothetical protein A2295_03695 [Candidatus Jacksonbacteria bacterium RIFOXYB2_FULL_44_15]OGY79067.1 MAG: hypothetical protein A2550_04590 [Candidatus Jacksonbacteria bacterium RIFOXYD2_FULL_43_21]OGY80297.1 MAG: hypotheti
MIPKYPHLQKIQNFYQHYRRMPSYREIMELVGWKSKNAVFKLVNKLVDQRLIKKDSHGRLLPSSLFHQVPLLGTVEAGFPSPAEEETSDTMSLDEYLITNKEATYLLKVQGDSMIEAGIMPGDLVLVERGTEPQDNAIVVAEIDGQWTLKYLRKRGKTFFLEAANKKYRPIFPKEGLNVAAVVKAVVRKY